MSASAEAEPLMAKAEKLNAEEYEREHAEWLARGKTGPYPLPLDAPDRRGYRTFFVHETPDWPDLEDLTCELSGADRAAPVDRP